MISLGRKTSVPLSLTFYPFLDNDRKLPIIDDYSRIIDNRKSELGWAFAL